MGIGDKKVFVSGMCIDYLDELNCDSFHTTLLHCNNRGTPVQLGKQVYYVSYTYMK